MIYYSLPFQKHTEITFYVVPNNVSFQLALTHSSFRVKYGTNPDHMRTSLSNCGVRMLEFGDEQSPVTHIHKRGEILQHCKTGFTMVNPTLILYVYNTNNIPILSLHCSNGISVYFIK